MDKLDNAIANTAYILDCLRALRSMCECGNCNNCGAKDCEHKPRVGQIVRYNCPLYVKDGDEKRAKEHPIVTNAMKFKEVFGYDFQDAFGALGCSEWLDDEYMKGKQYD